MNDENSYKIPILIGVLAAILFMLSHPILTALGLGWSVFIFTLFFMRLGKSLPIIELMLLIAVLQWIVGARIAYSLEFDHFKYFMYVSETDYMRLAVPGTIIFSSSILIFMPKQDFKQLNHTITQWVIKSGRIPYYLILFGFLSEYIGPYVPSTVGFVFYLLSSFQYVGLALLLFKPNNKGKWTWFLLIMSILTISSITRGMFHDLFLWSALMVSFVVLQFNWGWSRKLILIFAGFLAAFLVQSVKGQYRSEAKETAKDESGFGKFVDA